MNAVTETWRLLETWDVDPGLNMAVDEALLLTEGPPTLRFYTWRPPALSLGYFQRVDSVPGMERASVAVRRLTGGGAIHHENELTFSIACSLEHPLYRGEVKSSYERIHGLLAAVLLELGVTSGLRGEEGLRSDVEGSGMCFHRSTPLDLAWSGRKGVGSAQRRTRGRVLHHGSIKLAASELDTGVAELRPFVPELTHEELARRIRTRFEHDLELAFEPGSLSAVEERHAEERRSFFTSEAFVRRR